MRDTKVIIGKIFNSFFTLLGDIMYNELFRIMGWLAIFVMVLGRVNRPSLIPGVLLAVLVGYVYILIKNFVIKRKKK